MADKQAVRQAEQQPTRQIGNQTTRQPEKRQQGMQKKITVDKQQADKQAPRRHIDIRSIRQSYKTMLRRTQAPPAQ